MNGVRRDHGISLEAVMKDNHLTERKTKVRIFKTLSISRRKPTANTRRQIVCTLGPACWSTETLIKLIDSGLNVARFNFSHGDHESHYKALSRLRAACKARPNRHVAVMLDTKGPEIRTGFLESGDKVTYQRGQKLVLTTDYSFKGNEKRLACSYKSLPKSVKPGDRVLAADGSLVMKVLSCHPDKEKLWWNA